MKNTSSSRAAVLLRRALKKEGITQAQIAADLEVCQQTVSAWLHGRPMSLRSAVRVARRLGVRVEQIAEISP